LELNAAPIVNWGSDLDASIADLVYSSYNIGHSWFLHHELSCRCPKTWNRCGI